MPRSSRLRRAASLGLLLALAPDPVPAQEIYIWEDDSGVKHFSDRRPDGDYEVEVQRAIAAPEQPVRIANIGSEREPEWQLDNRLHGPVTVALGLDEAVNTISEPALPAHLEVAGRGRRSVLLGPLEPGLAWRYRLQMTATPGSLRWHSDPGHVYPPPVRRDTPVRIGQGFGGRFSHRQAHSRHAIDIPLPVGTPVVAVRDGRVMDSARWFHRNGRDPERDGPRANYVRVLHDDGTMAIYAHLDYGGVSVRDGQRVHAGQQLGHSGNTGYSTGPHLHFALQVNDRMQLRSIPFRMHDHDGRELDLGSITISPVDPGGETR